MEKKRLFFGFSVDAPWPSHYPEGRIIEEKYRHMTLSFLGNIDSPDLTGFVKPEFLIGPVGISDQILFLPEDSPRAIAHHVTWLVNGAKIESYQRQLVDWIEARGYKIDRRPFLSHVTLARAPFDQRQWEESFERIPLLLTGIHLYESIGNLHYPSLWSLPLTLPFEEFEHTADIAFHIRGTTFEELYLHGCAALAFKYSPFLDYIQKAEKRDLYHVVKSLNEMILHCDRDIGCPIKAVSFHGKVEEKEGMYAWEMIVDV